MENPQFSVSQFVEVANQTLEYAFGSILIEGEVSSFKLNQAKYIFFDLKDDAASVSCFMMAYQLRVPVEDGNRLLVFSTYDYSGGHHQEVTTVKQLFQFWEHYQEFLAQETAENLGIFH